MPPPDRSPQERAPDHISVELPDASDAAAHSRELVRATFELWGLGVLTDDAELAVSELVTNAFKHGLPPVRLTLTQREGRVQIDVSDTRPSMMTLEWPASADSDESGRGRGIVEAVSDRSGTDETPPDGKSAYASWNVDPHAASGL